MHHELKILPKYFKRVISKEKMFELRKNDRNFQVGDIVTLREFDDLNQKYTDWSVDVEITYILKDCAEYGLMDGYCIFGFKFAEMEVNEKDVF